MADQKSWLIEQLTNYLSIVKDKINDVDSNAILLRQDIDNLKSLSGYYIGDYETVAEMPTTPNIKNGDYAILKVDDGSNKSGFYVKNIQGWSFVFDLLSFEEAVATLIATDIQYNEGTSTTLVPSVKQVKDDINSLDNFWSKTGNADTTADTNFIGTTDNIDLIFKTNNVENFRISADGNIGIGKSDPTYKLDVTGNQHISEGLYFGIGGQYLGKGTFDRNGDGGISNFCAIGYELNWQAGSEYIYDNGGTIRIAQHKFNDPPDSSQDISQGYRIDSLFVLDNGTKYICTDNTIGTASWELYDIIIPGDFLIGSSINSSYLPAIAESDPIFNAHIASSITNINIANWNASWSRLGNSGTNPVTDFLGTTDAQPLIFKTNNTERLRVFTSGNIGVNTSTDSGSTLQVNGNIDLQGTAYIGSTTLWQSVTMGVGAGASIFFKINGANAVQVNNYGDLLLLGTNKMFRIPGDIHTSSAGFEVTTPVYGITSGFSLLSNGNIQRFRYTNVFAFESHSANYNSAVEHTRITNEGNWLLGTNINAGFKLDVNGTIRSSSDATINTLTVGRGTGNIATNTAIGFQALRINTTGSSNTSIGYQSMYSNTVGSSNTAIGMWSLTFANSSNNTAVGNNAGNGLTSGGDNTYLGHSSFLSNTTGSNNAGLGKNSGYFLTGSNNTLIGASAGTDSSFTSGSNNTIIGANVTPNSNVSNRVIIGDGQGNQRIQIFSNGNTSIGFANNATDVGDYKLNVNGKIKGGGNYAAASNTNVSVLQVEGLTSIPNTAGSIINISEFNVFNTGDNNKISKRTYFRRNNNATDWQGVHLFEDYCISNGALVAGQVVKSNVGTDYGGSFSLFSSSDNQKMYNGYDFQGGFVKHFGVVSQVTGGTQHANAVFNTLGSGNGNSYSLYVRNEATGSGQKWGLYSTAPLNYVPKLLVNTTIDAGYTVDINGTTRATSLTFTDGTQGLLFGNLSLLRVTGTFTSNENISFGRGASATDGGAGGNLSIGNFSSATGGSLAFGITANAGNSDVLDSIAIGRNALIDANVLRGVAIGRNANAKHGNAWAVGYNAVTYMANSFTFGDSSITSIFQGNVLVGTTTNSTYKLDVNGTARIGGNVLIGTYSDTATSSPKCISLGSSYGTNASGSYLNAKLKLYDNGGASICGFGVTASSLEMFSFGDIRLFSNVNVERFRITQSTGNVLIGTTVDAGFKLDVNGTFKASNGAHGIRIENQTQIWAGGSGTDIYSALCGVLLNRDNIGDTFIKGGTITITGTPTFNVNGLFRALHSYNTNSGIFEAGITAGGINIFSINHAGVSGNNRLIVNNTRASDTGENFQVNGNSRLSGVIIQGNITAPTTSVTDTFAMYANDITAGNSAPHFRTENGSIVKLYQETTAVSSANLVSGTGSNIKDTDTFDGYTVAQIVKALRNQGLLA